MESSPGLVRDGGLRTLRGFWTVAALFLAAGELLIGASPANAQQPKPETLPTVEVTAPTKPKQKPRPKRAPRQVATAAPVATTTPSEPSPQTNAAVGPPNAASTETFSGTEVNARPFTRPAEALEITPGLIITQHSGEGKASQYFLRGYNLDHGTDLAIFVDEMPVNMRTHGHGQGYADLNFLIPELIGSVDVRKGPYFADEGDFSSVGAIHVNLLSSLQKQVAQLTICSFGYQRYLGIGSTPLANGTLLYAGELAFYDGPWVNPDDMRKLNGVLRYSQGDANNGFSLSGMAYSNRWNSTDQVPLRAIASGQIGLYGALDPTDGGNSSRYSLSGRWAQTDDRGWWRANAYLVKSSLNLFNNFTFFLSDQTNGDQFHQLDDRTLLGAHIARTFKWSAGSLPMETTFGIQ